MDHPLDKTPNRNQEPNAPKDGLSTPESDHESDEQLWRKHLRSMMCLACTVTVAVTSFAPLAGYYASAYPTFSRGIEWGLLNTIIIATVHWPSSVLCIAAALAAGWILPKHLSNREIAIFCTGLPPTVFLLAYSKAAAGCISLACYFG